MLNHRVGNVTLSLPPDVRVVEEGEGFALHFHNFTGAIHLTAPPSSSSTKRDVLGSSEEAPISKRARQDESPADESEASAPNAVASAMRTVPQEVFRNGGLSQDDSDDDDSPMPAPRVISWEEVSTSAMPPLPSFAIPAEFEASPTGANADTPQLSRSAQQQAATAAAAAASGGSTSSARGHKSVRANESRLREEQETWPAAEAASAAAGQPPPASAGGARPALEIGAMVVAPAEGAVSAVPSVSPERLAALLQNPDAFKDGGAETPAGASVTGGASAAFSCSPSVVAAGASSSFDAPGLATRGDVTAFPFGRGEKLDVWEWEEVKTSGAVPTPRWGHCCASLSGALYVMGGDDLTDSDDDILRELHRFEPATGEWKRCRDAPHGRCWHSGTVVGGSVAGNSDILLVFGGETLKVGPDGVVAPGTQRSALNTMLSYDPEFEIWYEAVDRGTRPSARLGHSAALHTANGDGQSEKLIIFGGWNGGSRYAEPELRELHISSDWAWRRVLHGGTPPLARAYHTATPLCGQRLLVFGGHDGELRTFVEAHVLDLSCMMWHHPTVSGAAPAPRTGHVATCLDGVRVLVHGGWEPSGGADEAAYAMHGDLSILDTDTWVWTKPKVHGTPPCPRVGHSLAPHVNTADGTTALYAFGGRAANAALNDTYRLRPVTPKSPAGKSPSGKSPASSGYESSSVPGSASRRKSPAGRSVGRGKTAAH